MEDRREDPAHDADRVREEMARLQEGNKPSKFRFGDPDSVELHAEMSRNIELHNTLIRASNVLLRIDQQNQDLLDVFLRAGETGAQALPTDADDERRACFDLLH